MTDRIAEANFEPVIKTNVMKKLVGLLLDFVLFVCCSGEQEVKRPDFSDYFQCGMTALVENKFEDAVKYFILDLKDNKKNGYAYANLTMIYAREEENGLALSSAEKALKYLPKKDKEYIINVYDARAKVYLSMKDTVKALNDLTMAIRMMPDTPRLYEHRAHIYYMQDRYNLANSDFKKLTELDSGDTYGFFGLGCNAIEQEQWEVAISQFTHVLKLDNDYSMAYAFRAEAYLGLERWNEATDDIVSALRLGWNNKAVYLAAGLKGLPFSMMTAKLKAEGVKNPNDDKWPYSLGLLFEEKQDYTFAVKYYAEANNIEASDVTCYRMAYCSYKNDDLSNALRYINNAINMSEDDMQNSVLKASILEEAGDLKGSLMEWNKVVDNCPNDADVYYGRGWVKRMAGDLVGALDDFSMAILIDKHYSQALEQRGEIYQIKGEHRLAEADFKKVVLLEDKVESYSCVYFAYLGLGQNEKAVEVMNELIMHAPFDKENYYNAACLYVRMGDTDKALYFLEEAFKLGYRGFEHIKIDYDMDPLRNLPAFKALIEKYSSSRRNNVIDELPVENRADYMEHSKKNTLAVLI